VQIQQIYACDQAYRIARMIENVIKIKANPPNTMRIGSIVERKIHFPIIPSRWFQIKLCLFDTLFTSILLSYSFFYIPNIRETKKPIHFTRIGFIISW